MDSIHTIEADRPLLSQMLPLFDELERHFEGVDREGSTAVKRMKLPLLFERRKEKLWHRSFTAAYLLDPIHFIKDSEGAWVPPFSKLSADPQAEAVQCLVAITRPELANEVHREWTALMLDGFTDNLTREIMPALTERVQQENGKVLVAPVSRRRRWWATFGISQYPCIAAAAARLLGMPVTTCAAERNWSVWGQVYTKLRNRLAIERGEMIVFIRQNLKLQQGRQGDDEDIVKQLALDGADAEEA
jgi:hypothetical protein